MKVPSSVSKRLMPAANSSGRHSTAYQGSPAAAPLPAITIRVTSVAVSKPRPKRKPSGNICPGRETERVKRPRIRFMKPRASSCSSSSASS
ncbi:hypothetical protein GCM10020000_11220 [Streptomyces olivoverticillatus]